LARAAYCGQRPANQGRRWAVLSGFSHFSFLLKRARSLADFSQLNQNPEREVLKMATANLNVRPLHDRILVRRMAEEEKTAGGLIIPDTAKEKPQRGEVVATGKGRVTEDGKTLPLEVKAGDKVLFSKYSGTELKLEGNEYLMIREEDVLGVFQ
jgi:chaperonin GroES